jgi:branched-chain amino acid transport system substrate-binding protein
MPGDRHKKHGWKKCAMMPDAYDYGKLWSGLFEKYWKEKGGTITANIPVDFMKVSDYYPLLTKALATNPDCILLGSSSEPDAMQIQQARELGFKGGFLIIERGKLDEMEKFVKDKNVLNGTIGTAPVPFYPQANVKKFIQRCEKKYGKEPIVLHESSIPYAGVIQYLGAIQLAGTTTDVHKIMAAMKNPACSNCPS